MDFQAIAKKVASLGLPILGAALGGPAGSLVGKALGSFIGDDNATPEDILKVLTEDAAARQRAVEFQATHEVELKRIALEEKRIDMEDRNSARVRESSVKDSTNKTLAFVVVGSFVAVVGFSLAGYAKVDSALAGTLVGYLSAKAEQVIAYYFGSTSGSSEKTRLLASK